MTDLAGAVRSTRIDVVRAVAILAVIGVHSFQHAVALMPTALRESDRLFVVFSDLRYGVELFFVLSGWLIFSIYWSRPAGIRGYWPRRIARIWPLWIVFTCASFVATYLPQSWFGETAAPATPGAASLLVSFLVCVLFLGWTSVSLWNVPNGGWSIQVEMGHYALIWLLYRKRVVYLLCSILLGYSSYFAARGIANSSDVGSFVKKCADAWLRLGLYGTWPFFLVGGIGFLVWREGARDWKRLFAILIRSPLSLSLVAAIVITGRWIPVPLGTTYEAAACVAVLLGIAWAFIKIERGQAGLASLGRYSYFMYFMHFWILEFLFALMLPRFDASGSNSMGKFLVMLVVIFVTTVLSSWILAKLSWRWIESFWIRLASRKS